jgi:nicotinamidase-related amidase
VNPPLAVVGPNGLRQAVSGDMVLIRTVTSAYRRSTERPAIAHDADASNRLDPTQTLLAIIDLQETFRSRIGQFERIARRAAFVASAARLLDIPIVVSEQYPQGLGPTAHELDEPLAGTKPVPKQTFSALGAPDFRAAVAANRRAQIIVVGIETHICVLQTALGLIKEGFAVHILVDVTGSQRDHDRVVALRRLEAGGVVMSTAETAIFELVLDSGASRFQPLLELVKAELTADGCR